MAEKTPEELAAEQAEAKKAEDQKLMRTEIYRDISKNLGINAFDPTELKGKLDEYENWKKDQMSEQEKLQESLNAYQSKETEWTNKEKAYEFKFGALGKSIDPEKIDKAFKLTDGDVTKLDDLIKEFPSFQKSKKKQDAHVILKTKEEEKNPESKGAVYEAWKKKRGR